MFSGLFSGLLQFGSNLRWHTRKEGYQSIDTPKTGFRLILHLFHFSRVSFCSVVLLQVSLLLIFGSYSFFKKGPFAFKLTGKKPDFERESR